MEIRIDSAADQAVLSALREGKRRQGAILLVRYYGTTIFNVCRTLVPDTEAAEDLTQASFKQAFSSMGGIVGSVSPRVWLMNVAQQCCAGYLRQVTDATDAEAPLPDPQAVAAAGNARMPESLQRRLEMLAAAL
jgi:DNA-directed RNA polymerase specialized sigma24 family protein